MKRVMLLFQSYRYDQDFSNMKCLSRRRDKKLLILFDKGRRLNLKKHVKISNRRLYNHVHTLSNLVCLSIYLFLIKTLFSHKAYCIDKETIWQIRLYPFEIFSPTKVGKRFVTKIWNMPIQTYLGLMCTH